MRKRREGARFGTFCFRMAPAEEMTGTKSNSDSKMTSGPSQIQVSASL